jgi:hypothetical protein
MRKQNDKRAVTVIIHNHGNNGGFGSRWKRFKVALLSGAAGFLAGTGFMQWLM